MLGVFTTVVIITCTFEFLWNCLPCLHPTKTSYTSVDRAHNLLLTGTSVLPCHCLSLMCYNICDWVGEMLHSVQKQGYFVETRTVREELDRHSNLAYSLNRFGKTLPWAWCWISLQPSLHDKSNRQRRHRHVFQTWQRQIGVHDRTLQLAAPETTQTRCQSNLLVLNLWSCYNWHTFPKF